MVLCMNLSQHFVFQDMRHSVSLFHPVSMTININNLGLISKQWLSLCVGVCVCVKREREQRKNKDHSSHYNRKNFLVSMVLL